MTPDTVTAPRPQLVLVANDPARMRRRCRCASYDGAGLCDWCCTRIERRRELRVLVGGQAAQRPDRDRFPSRPSDDIHHRRERGT